MKTIAGADSLYSFQYAFRLPPSQILAHEALDYLQHVTACDTRAPAHPCPKLTPLQ